MQSASIDANSKNNDVIVLSPTGSGKTLAFLLPLLQTLDVNKDTIQALVLTPSRELALQTEDVFKRMKTGFKVNSCYGGHNVKIEINNLSQAPALLIGTPGRIADLVDRGVLNLKEVSAVVLDEFDKSLEYGFQDQMSFIMGKLPGLTKRILTSATNAETIPGFAGVKKPIRLNFLQTSTTNAKLEVKQVISDENDKLNTLLKLVCKTGNKPMLVFLNHREAVERVSEFFEEKGMVHSFFHGGLEQFERERTIAKFRNGSCPILITTDLASRGLDIPEIEYVVHYHLPLNEEAYTHRNGRTARMHAKGMVYILLSGEEKLPDFIKDKIPVERLQDQNSLPKKPEWVTLYIGKGKKDNINKVDIVGFLCKKGQLDKSELGLIEVKDTFAYVAVRRNKANELIQLVKEEKLKNQKVKIDLAK